MQRGIHNDLQAILVELQSALGRDSHKPTTPGSQAHQRLPAGKADPRSTAGKELNQYCSPQPELPIDTDVLPGAVAPTDASLEVDERKPLMISDGAMAIQISSGSKANDPKDEARIASHGVSNMSGETSDRKSTLSDSSELPAGNRTTSGKMSRSNSKAEKNDRPVRGISSAKRRSSAGQKQSHGFEWMTNPEASKSPIQRRLLYICNHNVFDYIVAALICLNGLMVGIQTDYMAQKSLEDPPLFFQVVEIIFCVVFTVELTIRLIAFRCAFFLIRAQRAWNIFDFVIVNLQLVEIFMSLVAAGVGFSFNILRILRLIRVVRLARALRLIGELRTIVSSIAGSVKPLFWTGVLLFLIAYVVGVALTQLVHTKRMRMIEDGEYIPDVLDTYWGHLIPAIFTLIMAITGGVDWDTVCRPLIEKIGVEVGVLFTFYILFSSLAMLNVVTGVFIDSVMVNKKEEIENRTMDRVQSLFQQLDVDDAGELHWEEFESQLDRKEMKDFFRIIDVDTANAKSLFELLDLDDSGSVDAHEFMDGCLRIWAPAKGLDLRMISRDIIKIQGRLSKISDILEEKTPRASKAIKNGLLIGVPPEPNLKMVTAG